MDEEAILDLIGSVYDAAVNPTKWQNFLTKFSDTQGGAAVGMVSKRGAGLGGRLSYTVRCDPSWQQQYDQHYAMRDVFVERLKQVEEAGGVWRGQALIDDADLIKSEFYAVWMAPQDLFHTVHCLALRDGDQVVTLGAGRGRLAGYFEPQEMRVWDILTPHISRAIQIQKLNSDLMSARNVMAGGLSRRSVGLILAGVDGSVADANAFADQVLTEDDGLTVKNRKLTVTKRREQDRLNVLIHGAVELSLRRLHAGGGFLKVSRQSGREPYKVLVTPAPDGMPFLEKKSPAAAIYVLDPEIDIQLDLRDLQAMFDLTHAESNVAVLITKGMDVNEAAQELGISKNTVRTHLKRVFEKSGTKRQSQLVLKILSTIP